MIDVIDTELEGGNLEKYIDSIDASIPDLLHIKKRVGVCFHPPEKLDDDFAWQLYADLVRETALSYDAALYIVSKKDEVKTLFRDSNVTFIDSYHQSYKTPVLLSKEGEAINNATLPSRVLFICGSDNGEWHEAGVVEQRVKIETPRSYPLWSAVTAGIALHEFSKTTR